ncbi:MAG: CopG family antitoxin, partial [Chloroflexota bacterium]
MKKKTLPKFKTTEEVADFWGTHSIADYWDELEEVELKVHPSIKSPRDLSPRCPHHKNQVLYSRWRT